VREPQGLFSAIFKALENIGASVESFGENLKAKGLPLFKGDFASAESGESFSVAGGGGVVRFHGSIMPQSAGSATAKSLFLFFFLAWESVPGLQKCFFIFPIDKVSA
jgi:hypothetical protein